MIRFSLVCEDEHPFEGWFKSNAGFDRQAAANAIECPTCGSTRVRKALMAPAIAKGRRGDDERAAPVAGSGTAAASPPAPAEPPSSAQFVAAAHFVRALHKYVEVNFENVGKRFSEEARRIHYGETEERGIYGQASREDIESLADEGIAVDMLPPLPELDS